MTTTPIAKLDDVDGGKALWPSREQLAATICGASCGLVSECRSREAADAVLELLNKQHTASLDRERVLREALPPADRLELLAKGLDQFNDGSEIQNDLRKWASGIRAALAATSSPDAMNGWQPIETAPKDATWVLVRVPVVGRLSPDYRIIHAHWAHGGGDDQPEFGPDWFYDTGYGFHNVSPKPTHWMPFDPPSPTPQTETR